MNDKDDDEEINEAKIKNQDVLTEEELLNTTDMSAYKERIEKIIGRNYSNLYFYYFENIYHYKIKNKITSPLNIYLNKSNKEDSFWMQIYKSIKFYSKEKIPILIGKYFYLKAEIEFKFIYNESKKFTNNSNKFIDIYIKKMKKANYKKLNELKVKNQEANYIFGIHPKKSIFLKNYITKKTILRPKKSRKNLLYSNIYEEHSDSSTKEEEIKNKKHIRGQIMMKIRQLKIKSIKEVEKANNLQNKQKKKYGGIKSRFLDLYNAQQNIMKIINNKKINKTNNIKNNFNFNKNISKEEDELYQNSQRKKCSISSGKISYYYNYCNKNSKYLNEEKSNNYNNYYLNSLTSSNRRDRASYINTLRSNRTNFEGWTVNNQNKKKLYLFTLLPNNKNNTEKTKKFYNNIFHSKNCKDVNKLIISTNLINKYKIRTKSSLMGRRANTKLILNKLERKNNKEFLEHLLTRNNKKDEYNNKLYELFKKTECF